MVQKKKPGLAPGSLVYTGNHATVPVEVDFIRYKPDSCEYQKNISCADIPRARPETDSVVWLNVEGLSDPAVAQQILEVFHIHPLALEDCLHVEQRPKVDIFDEHVLIILPMLYFKVEERQLIREQVGLLFGRHFVITLQEVVGDVLQPIRESLQRGGPKIRREGADYLAYAIVDAIVDNYMLTLDVISTEVEGIDLLEAHTDYEAMALRVHEIKRVILNSRRLLAPLREGVRYLIHDDTTLVSPETKLHFRDVVDHIIRTEEQLETMREGLHSMLELHLALANNRTNEVVRFLTVVSTIFIPLTFLVGVYGMNFHFMPELSWQYGYFLVWVVMVFGALGMVLIFRRRGWM